MYRRRNGDEFELHPLGNRAQTWPARATAIKQALRKAGMSKDVNLEMVAGPASTDARQSQYTRWLSADLDEPALLDMDSGWTLNYINRKQLLNLNKELPKTT